MMYDLKALGTLIANNIVDIWHAAQGTTPRSWYARPVEPSINTGNISNNSNSNNQISIAPYPSYRGAEYLKKNN